MDGLCAEDNELYGGCVKRECCEKAWIGRASRSRLSRTRVRDLAARAAQRSHSCVDALATIPRFPKARCTSLTLF